VSCTDQLEAAVKDLSDKALDLSCAPDQWTIRQIVHHVTDGCGEWNSCIRKAIATPGAVVRFEGYPGNEAWANALKFESRSILTGLTLLKVNYQYLAELLTYFPDAWDQTIVIRDDQGNTSPPLSIREMIKMLTEHAQEHLGEVEAIKKSYLAATA
jgi:hypothetical protein